MNERLAHLLTAESRTWMFITINTEACQWTWPPANKIQLTSSDPISLGFIIILSSHLLLGVPRGWLHNNSDSFFSLNQSYIYWPHFQFESTNNKRFPLWWRVRTPQPQPCKLQKITKREYNYATLSLGDAETRCSRLELHTRMMTLLCKKNCCKIQRSENWIKSHRIF